MDRTDSPRQHRTEVSPAAGVLHDLSRCVRMRHPEGRPPQVGRARLSGAAAVVATVVALSGCASTLPTQVTTFHQLPSAQALAGRQFALVATGEQQGSLEHASYAARVREALVKRGMVEATTGTAADYSVSMRYGSSAAAEGWGGRGSGVGVSGGVSGGGFSLGGLGVGIGIGFPLGRGRQAATTYRHEFEVDMDRRTDATATEPSPAVQQGAGPTGAGAPAAEGQAPTSRVFEGRAVAETDSASLAAVAPALIEALFSQFPGTSGVTQAVEVKLPQP